MSGHSKWANIKHRKGAKDAKRAKVFTRIIKELTVAAKEGGGDPDMNPRLRTAVQNAKGANMPKDTITRAIKKATDADAANYLESTFEGHANNGVAVFVECLSDNNNRTVASVRATFNKYGGALGKNGSIEFLFDRKGVFTFSKGSTVLGLEELEMELIDAGLEELTEEGGTYIAYSLFEDFGDMQQKLEELNIEVNNAELQRIPNNTKVLDVSNAKKVLHLIDKFDEDDDVQNVFHNLELTEELISALEENC